MSDPPRILVVDDDEIHREVIQRLLSKEFQLLEADTGHKARTMLASVKVDCVLLDYRLPDFTALELLPEMTAKELPVLIFTSLVTEKLARETRAHGAIDCLQKDRLSRESLRASIATALEQTKIPS